MNTLYIILKADIARIWGGTLYNMPLNLGQALHIVDIDFVIYESDTWSNPHYRLVTPPGPTLTTG